jgi:hypothetical protein
MADFFAVHRKDIESAFRYAERPGWHFQILVKEPRRPITEPPPESVCIVTFERLHDGHYRPAAESDRNTIAKWHERHHEADEEEFGAHEWI